MAEREIEVLLPTPELEGDQQVRLAPRLEALAGSTIGLINNGWLSLDTTYDEFQHLLRSQWEVRELIVKAKAKSSPLPQADLEELARRAHAIITGLGN